MCDGTVVPVIRLALQSLPLLKAAVHSELPVNNNHFIIVIYI